MATELSRDIVINTPNVTLNDVQGAPEPLRREIAPPGPYPVGALGPTLAPMTQKLIEVIQAPAALCSQSTLAAAALATQALANVVIDGRSHPLSEFFLTVGESGERKTAVDRCALWPHRQRERTLYEAYDIDYIAYQNDADAYRKAREEALRKHKGHHDKRAALAALGPPPLPLQG